MFGEGFFRIYVFEDFNIVYCVVSRGKSGVRKRVEVIVVVFLRCLFRK